MSVCELPLGVLSAVGVVFLEPRSFFLDFGGDGSMKM